MLMETIPNKSFTTSFQKLLSINPPNSHETTKPVAVVVSLRMMLAQTKQSILKTTRTLTFKHINFINKINKFDYSLL